MGVQKEIFSRAFSQSQHNFEFGFSEISQVVHTLLPRVRWVAVVFSDLGQLVVKNALAESHFCIARVCFLKLTLVVPERVVIQLMPKCFGKQAAQAEQQKEH